MLVWDISQDSMLGYVNRQQKSRQEMNIEIQWN